MSLDRLTPERRAAILAAYREYGSFNEAARAVGANHRTVAAVVNAEKAQETGLRPIGPLLRRADQAEGLPPLVQELLEEQAKNDGARETSHVAEAETPISHTEDGDKASVEFASPKRIRTLEDAIAFAEVDTRVWRVSKWSCTSWETGLKIRSFNERGKVIGETPARTHQWRVKLDLERILPKPLQAATDAFFASMKAYSPTYPPLAKRATPKRPHMCVVDLFDVHFGKLAWKPETGDNYDLKIAEQLYRNAVIDLLSHAAAYEIDQFVLPIGNDFFHIDGLKNETTNGTPQDVDGRPAKIFEVGARSVVWAVDEMRRTGPVKIPVIPGNHDRFTSFLLGQYLAAWFRNCDDVTVDGSPMPRKRVRYGTNLIGFTHGNEEKHSSLPTIMATEWKQDWAETTCHEWHIGHFHRAKKTETTSVDHQDGVDIRTLRSLSGTDAWHARRGYGGGLRAAEAYVYGYDYGHVGHFVAKARLDQEKARLAG